MATEVASDRSEPPQLRYVASAAAQDPIGRAAEHASRTLQCGAAAGLTP
jgi:hypothetical protein